MQHVLRPTRTRRRCGAGHGDSYLQVLDAGRQRSGVGAGFAARGVDVALDGVLRLVAGLVERAQIHPGRGVTVIQLHGADVRLQRVHGLILLLIQHATRANGQQVN